MHSPIRLPFGFSLCKLSLVVFCLLLSANTHHVLAEDGESRVPSDAPSLVPSPVDATAAPATETDAGVSRVPSDMPSLAPSFAPSISAAPTITPRPTTTASSSPTTGPTSPPSAVAAETTSPSAPAIVQGQVVLVLQTVERVMTGTVLTSFNEDVTMWYQQNLPYANVVAEAEPNSQTLLSSTRQRRLSRMPRKNSSHQPHSKIRRDLQEMVGSPLEVVLNVQADLMQPIATEDFERQLQAVTNANSSDLIVLLQDSTSIVTRSFFESLVEVTAIDGPGSFTSIEPSSSGGNDDGLSGGAIAGIVIGVLVGVGLLVAGGYWYKSTHETEKRSAKDNSAVMPSASTGVSTTSNVLSPNNTGFNRQHDQGPELSDSESGGAVYSDMNSEMDSRIGDQSMQADNMSYAYSLDPGQMDTGTIAGQSTYAYARGGGGGGSMVGSEIAQSVSTADVDTVDASRRSNMVAREVLAPPGKLGIVIDTTLDGPVVHKVNGNSPLEGVLFPGDIIISIDEVDTRAMSASAITGLMVKTANQRRKLRVLSEDTQ
jgi:hypothetical protein